MSVLSEKGVDVLFLRPPSGSNGRNVVRDFIYGCWCNGRRIGGMQMPPLVELYVATYVRQAGLRVGLLDVQMEPDRFDGLCRGRFEGVAAVVVMSSTQSFRQDVATLSAIKDINPSIRSVLFGSHPTFMPAFCLQQAAVDYLVLREPEESLRCLLLAIINNGRIDAVAGVAYRAPEGSLRVNAPRPFINLDALPIPDRDLLPAGIDYFNPVVRRMPYTTMQTSRGCPGRCIFCTAPQFYGTKWRARSAVNVLEELREVKRMGYREVFFRDETFTAFKKRNRDICEAMLRENFDLAWIANGRVDMVDAEMLALMKSAGCHLIKFGVESGDDAILQNYRKQTTTEQAERAIRMAQEVGLDIHAHLVFGGPGETPDTIEKTIRFVLKLKPTTASFGILTPYPGTELFNRVVRHHPEVRDGTGSNMDNLHVEGFYSECVCGLDGGTLLRAVTQAYRRFYLRPSYLFQRLTAVRNLDQFMTLSIAGANIINFSLRGKK